MRLGAGIRTYCRIGNQGLDWPAKARRAREILNELFQEVL
jgi:hypothetical protein